ncbi:MAG: hypothetical protein WCS72_04685 [Deltaproteobacteria bacterium]
MRKIGSAVVVAAALVFAAPAGAQVALDLKVGYAIPTGDLMAFGGSDYYGPMKYTWSGAVPIEVAGRYRFSPSFSAGVYYQYAPAFIATRFCASGMTCSGYDMRVGVEAVYAFLPERAWNPWVSVGTGWEWTHFSVATADASSQVTYSGWEYFNVQAGLDWNLSKTFAFGPYVGFFGGSYSTLTGNSTGPGAGGAVSGSIPSGYRAFHGWLQFGLKGTVTL